MGVIEVRIAVFTLASKRMRAGQYVTVSGPGAFSCRCSFKRYFVDTKFEIKQPGGPARTPRDALIEFLAVQALVMALWSDHDEFTESSAPRHLYRAMGEVSSTLANAGLLGL